VRLGKQRGPTLIRRGCRGHDNPAGRAL